MTTEAITNPARLLTDGEEWEKRFMQMFADRIILWTPTTDLWADTTIREKNPHFY